VTCRLCNEPLGVTEPVERHMGSLVHAKCQHDFEQGFDHDEKETG